MAKTDSLVRSGPRGWRPDEDPQYQPVQTLSRIPHPETTENSFLAETLQAAINVKTYIKRGPEDQLWRTVVCMDFSLGDGLNGIAGVCHGAVIGIILDETMGQLAATVLGRERIATKQLLIEYKRMLRAPVSVLCTARASGPAVDGRLTITATVQDSGGVVYDQGEAVFAEINARL